MAKYRLLSAHYMNDQWLPGDKETVDRGDEKGTIVGDGTSHPVKWPTLEMEPLDDDAREMIAKEQHRLEINDASMEPIEDLPMDNYEREYIPGTNRRRRPAPPDGSPVVMVKED